MHVLQQLQLYRERSRYECLQSGWLQCLAELRSSSSTSGEITRVDFSF
jgi:hypothetical protein